MAKSNPEIVCEGWLTKSPPTKRLWRGKWRRRWFALKQSAEIPGQYFLEYYADRNCRKLKGTIDLDLCEQVDSGLYMERSGVVLSGGTKLRGSVFSVKTQARTYHLEADTEADMERWVNAICSVCGLRKTDEKADQMYSMENGNGEDGLNGDFSSPYIRISECITGVRSNQDNEAPRKFTFCASVVEGKGATKRVNNNDKARDTGTGSEDSLSDDECNVPLQNSGPPVPPRPPKTFRYVRDGTHDATLQKERLNMQRSKILAAQERKSPISIREHCTTISIVDSNKRIQQHRAAMSNYINTSPGKMCNMRQSVESPSFQYLNVPCSPPAVDRNLKPQHTSCSAINCQDFLHSRIKQRDMVNYLDLDLRGSPKPSTSKAFLLMPDRRVISHGKSLSMNEADISEYKEVDFLKTEALNSTRQDAEASRNKQ